MGSDRSKADGGQTVRDVSSGPLAAIPLDIVVLLVFLAVAVPFVLGVGSVPAPVQVLLGLPLVMFLPGYALTTALFPKRARGGFESDISALGSDAIPHRIRSLSQRGLTGIERASLGFAVSIVLVPLYGFVIDFTPLDYSTETVVAILVVVTAVASIAAFARHREHAPVDTTGYTVAGALVAFRRSLRRPKVDATLTVVVVVCLLFAGVSGAFALTSPLDRNSFTGFYLVTQNDEGEYVEGGYPTSFTVGEPSSLYVGIENQERQPMTYSVVVQLQRVRTQGDDVSVLTRDRLASFSTRVGAGETTYAQTSLTPESLGENFRLTYLLYRGEPPENPTTQNAYRHTFIWVDVTGQGQANASTTNTSA